MYYFIGIKGSGMASLARILHDLGHEVKGSDISKYIFLEDELRSRNIEILDFDKNNIKDGYIVIVGNAFKDDHEEVKAALNNETCTIFRYHEFLSQLMEQYITIAIAGTHGKTTTTGMTYHLFKAVNKTSVLIGDGTGIGVADAKYFIAESCEYQDHFLHYYPNYGLINNIELDHVDYFKSINQYKASFEQFASQVKKCVVAWGDDPYLPDMKLNNKVLFFGLNSNNDVIAKNIIESKDGMSFDVYIHQELFGSFALPFFGKHMLLNSLAVITLGYLENVSASLIQEQLKTFEGVKRRYSIKTYNDCIFVDDYAHHPTAIKAVIQATKIRYPKHQVVAIFKPDRFSRIQQFAKQFAESLNQADFVYLCHFPINAVKEEGIDVDINEIAQYIPKAVIINEDQAAAKELANFQKAVYLFMSSKDIYLFEEKLILEKKNM